MSGALQLTFAESAGPGKVFPVPQNTEAWYRQLVGMLPFFFEGGGCRFMFFIKLWFGKIGP